MHEFDPPAPLQLTFCEQISDEVYKLQQELYTDYALGELAAVIEETPDLYLRTRQKRKIEEEEERREDLNIVDKILDKFYGFLAGREEVGIVCCSNAHS